MEWRGRHEDDDGNTIRSLSHYGRVLITSLRPFGNVNVTAWPEAEKPEHFHANDTTLSKGLKEVARWCEHYRRPNLIGDLINACYMVCHKKECKGQ